MTVSNETDTTSATGAVLTDSAAAKAKALLDQEGRDDLALEHSLAGLHQAALDLAAQVIGQLVRQPLLGQRLGW